MNRSLLSTLALSLLALFNPAFADTYPGNGATGFGGSVGTGSITITDTPTSLTLSFNRGAGQFNDALVLYIDSQAGGFTDNSSFGDNADGGREAISGTNNGNPSQTLVSLPFAADYAMAIQNGFIGVFQLASGGNNSLVFLFGVAQSGNNSDASYSITLTAAQMAQIGLTAASGQSFQFVGSLISASAYRSNETIGASTTTPGDGSGNAGFSNPQTFDSALSFTLVPEPSVFALLGVGVTAFGIIVRSRKNS